MKACSSSPDARAAARARRAVRGFTLIEVMVALVIVALGMMAVNTQLNQFAVTSVYMEEKTLASWIATNRLTELSIAPQWPELGEREEQIDFAGRAWHMRIEISETDVPNIRRADVAVAAADAPERVLQETAGFIEPPAPPGFAPPQWLAPAGSAFGRGGGAGG